MNSLLIPSEKADLEIEILTDVDKKRNSLMVIFDCR